MLNNQQQLNNDDFSDFDFDESDVLVKDGGEEINPPSLKLRTGQGKSRNQEINVADGHVGSLANKRGKIGALLELKKFKIRSGGSAKEVRENLVKQAAMQKEKVEALSREGEGLVYNERDEEEIERFKKKPLVKNNFDIDVLVRDLMAQINIVSTLKIDLIQRLKNIISSYLRDVRIFAATKELLQRPISEGGLNLSIENVSQIMSFIKIEYDKIHSVLNTIRQPAEQKHENTPPSLKLRRTRKTLKYKNTSVAPLTMGGGGEKENVEIRKHSASAEAALDEETANAANEDAVELFNNEMDVISKKTAREAQIGVFSNEIIDFKRFGESKKEHNYTGKKDVKQWKKGLAIPDNLRVPEVSSPKPVKKIDSGVGRSGLPKNNIQIDKPKDDSNILRESDRKEVLKSLNEALEEDKRISEVEAKNSMSWWSKLFKKSKVKRPKSVKKSRKQENKKTPKESRLPTGQARKQEITQPSNQAVNKSKNQEVGGLKVSKGQSLKSIGSQAQSLKPKVDLPQKPVARRSPVIRQGIDNRPKLEDVKVVHPHLVGPIEELSEMTLLDFRRLGSTPQDSVDKIRNKVELVAKDFFNQKVNAINGWKNSEVNQLYISLVKKSLLEKVSVDDLIEQYAQEGKNILTKEEFDLINQLNKELRY